MRHCSDLLIVPYANPRGTAASAMAQPFPVPMMAGSWVFPLLWLIPKRSDGRCRKRCMPFTRRAPARRVVSCERRADHELNLMEHHQWYDHEPNVPGEQQGCYRQAA